MTATIRVTKTTTVGFGNDANVSSDIVWEGNDLAFLSTQYPPSDIFGADPLGHSEIEDGYIRFDHKFEQFVAGKWQEIDDPRVRLTPMTALERAIDADNRRDFPGDYITEDDDEDYDPYGPSYEHEPEYDCDNCHDHGCPDCRPDLYPEEPECKECGLPYSADRLNEDGHCASCVEYLAPAPDTPQCADCQQFDVDKEGDLCTFCEEEHAKKRCCNCNEVHKDPALADGDVCKDCEDYWQKWAVDYHVWWRRLFRWLRLMK